MFKKESLKKKLSNLTPEDWKLSTYAGAGVMCTEGDRMKEEVG